MQLTDPVLDLVIAQLKGRPVRRPQEVCLFCLQNIKFARFSLREDIKFI